MAGGGQCSANLILKQGKAFVPGPSDPIAGGTDDAMNGLAAGIFAEEPLQWPLDECSVRFGENGPIEPEVRAEDRHTLDLFQAAETLIHLGEIPGNPFRQRVMIRREDDGIDLEDFAIMELNPDDGCGVESQAGTRVPRRTSRQGM